MSNYQNNSFLNSIPIVTRNILIINFLIWIVCYLFQFRGIYLVNTLALYPIPYGFKLYQLFTFMFTQIDFTHLFFNMFAVFMFGRTLEQYWGSNRFLIYYMVCGIGSGLVQLLVCYLTYSFAPTIGASGAVFGILLAFGMLFPNVSLYIMFIPIPIKAKYFVIFYGLLELYLGFANRSGDNVAHFAHLGGMLFGVFMILYWNHKNKNNRGNYTNRNNSILRKIGNLFNKKNVKMHYKRPETDMEYNTRKIDQSVKIDRILDKVKHSGYNSLTEEEKKTLFDAGKK
jgi:Uncharacterized membrane protein (homolog of Drosophila rhomboid)